MPATVRSLGIDHLPIHEQVALVREIWDHIMAAGAKPLLSEAQLQELRRRVAEGDSDPDALIPWEEVKAQALKRAAP